MIWEVDRDIQSDGAFRSIVSLGAHWEERAFYDKAHVDKKYGKFDPNRLSLRFDQEERHLPIPDFPRIPGFPPTCLKERFEFSFAELLNGFVETIEVKVAEKTYTAIVPSLVFDLFDENRSVGEYFKDDGTPLVYSSVKLRNPPERSVPIFRVGPPRRLALRVYVDDRFPEIYENEGLTGLRFTAAL